MMLVTPKYLYMCDVRACAQHAECTRCVAMRPGLNSPVIFIGLQAISSVDCDCWTGKQEDAGSKHLPVHYNVPFPEYITTCALACKAGANSQFDQDEVIHLQVKLWEIKTVVVNVFQLRKESASWCHMTMDM